MIKWKWHIKKRSGIPNNKFSISKHISIFIKYIIKNIKWKWRKISSSNFNNLIKNIILKNEFTQKWFNLNDNEKTEIKNHILSSLASSDIDIRKAAGIAIASICKIEIPNKQWLNIFDTLINTSQNENLFIQLSSITTLGFIFTEIKVNDISQDIIANILNCFYIILKKDNINFDLL